MTTLGSEFVVVVENAGPDVTVSVANWYVSGANERA